MVLDDAGVLDLAECGEENAQLLGSVVLGQPTNEQAARASQCGLCGDQLQQQERVSPDWRERVLDGLWYLPADLSIAADSGLGVNL